MQILDFRPFSGVGSTVARFDVQFSDGIRLYNLQLKNTSRGWRVFAPNFDCAAVATFSREVAETLTEEAVKMLGAKTTNDRIQ